MEKLKGNSGSGQSLIEALVALSIFTLGTATIGFLVIDANVASKQGIDRTEAVLLSREGLEAVRSIRDASFDNLTAGVHGLALAGNVWTFSGSSDTQGQYTRSVAVSDVNSNTKKIVSSINWQFSSGRNSSVSLATYLTNWTRSLIGNWANQFQEASINIFGANDGRKIKVQDDFAYVIRNDGAPDFAVVNIANTASPAIIGSLNLSGVPENIYVSGNYAYIASQNDTQELQIINISNPSLPAVVGYYDIPGTADANGIFVNGSYAYLVRDSSADKELVIVNVSNPNSPTLTGSLELGASAYEIAVIGNYAYVASGHNSQELQVVNVSAPNSPSFAGSYNISGTSDALTIEGFSNNVILGQGNRIYIFDISIPSIPSQIGSLNLAGTVNDLALGNSNNYLFIATANSNPEFYAADISALSSPGIIGVYDVAGKSILYGVAYSPEKDRVFVVGNSDTEEFIVIAPQ